MKSLMVLDDDRQVCGRMATIMHGRDIDWTIFRTIDMAIDMADVMVKMGSPLNFAIVDFDLIDLGDGRDGNDAARAIKAISPTTIIIGNTGGPLSRFDRSVIDRIMTEKIWSADDLLKAIG